MKKNNVEYPNNQIESEQYINNFSHIYGVDECGIGSLIGPVVSVALKYHPLLNSLPINDSKKLSPKKRESLYSEIVKFAKFSFGFSNKEEVDQINVIQAGLKSMQNAVRALYNDDFVADLDKDNISTKTNNQNNSSKLSILIDGNKSFSSDFIKIEHQKFTIIKGDSQSVTIAAASIICKTFRDYIITNLDKIHPKYYWIQNKGYATKKHIESIMKYGITDEHRLSMVKNFINYI